MRGMLAGISNQVATPDHAILAENVNFDTVGAIRSKGGSTIYVDSGSVNNFTTSNTTRVLGMKRVYVSEDVKSFMFVTDTDLVAPKAGTQPTETSGNYSRDYSPLSSLRPNIVNVFAPAGAQFQWATGSQTVTVAYLASTTNTNAHRCQSFVVQGANVKDPQFVVGSDNQYCILNEPKQNNYCALLLKDFRFDSDIPQDATIQGIQVDIEGLFSTTSTAAYKNVQLGNLDDDFGGTGSRDGTAKTITNGTTENTVSYGGSADLWGLTTTTCTPNYLRSDQFFIYVDYLSAAATDQLRLDDVSIKVYFTGGSNANLTKNVYRGDYIQDDAVVIPVDASNNIDSISAATTAVHKSSSGSNHTNQTSYFVHPMSNRIGTVIEPINKLRRVVVANGNNYPFEYGLQPNTFGLLGNTAPASALTLTTSTASALITAGTYQYKYTFASEHGESNGSPSGSVTLAANGQIAVSAADRGPNKVLRRNVYRTSNGGSTFYLNHTIEDNTTASYTDTMGDTTLLAQAAFDEADRSTPYAFSVVRWHQNRLWGLIDGDNKVYFSNILKPDEWDLANSFIQVPDGEQPRNMMSLGDSLVIYTNRSISMIQGRSEESFSAQLVESNVGIYSRWTLQSIDIHNHIFLARDGFRVFSGIKSQRIGGIESDILFAIDAPEQGQTEYRMARAYVNNCSAFYWRNKYILLYPAYSSEFADRMMVYDFDAQSVAVMRSPTHRVSGESSESGGSDKFYSITSWDGPSDSDSLMVGGDSRIWKVFTGNLIEDPEKYTGGPPIENWDVICRWNSHHINCDVDGDKVFKGAHLIVNCTAGKMRVEAAVDRIDLGIGFQIEFQSTGRTERITVPFSAASNVTGQEVQLRVTYQGQAQFSLEGFDIDFEADEAYLDRARIT